MRLQSPVSTGPGWRRSASCTRRWAGRRRGRTGSAGGRRGPGTTVIGGKLCLGSCSDLRSRALNGTHSVCSPFLPVEPLTPGGESVNAIEFEPQSNLVRPSSLVNAGYEPESFTALLQLLRCLLGHVKGVRFAEHSLGYILAAGIIRIPVAVCRVESIDDLFQTGIYRIQFGCFSVKPSAIQYGYSTVSVSISKLRNPTNLTQLGHT